MHKTNCSNTYAIRQSFLLLHLREEKSARRAANKAAKRIAVTDLTHPQNPGRTKKILSVSHPGMSEKGLTPLACFGRSSSSGVRLPPSNRTWTKMIDQKLNGTPFIRLRMIIRRRNAAVSIHAGGAT
jgi:hypothetical protein